MGRLVLETILPDGSCDPAAALVGRSPIESKNGGGKGEAQDVMVIRKRFYADRSFSRANVNGEGPGRGMPTARCEADTQVGGKSSNNNKGGKPPPAGSLAICTRHEHVGAPRGDAVLPLREVAGTRGCLPPNSNGACPAPDGYVAPPPPPKKKKPRTPPSTPPAEQEAVNAPPRRSRERRHRSSVVLLQRRGSRAPERRSWLPMLHSVHDVISLSTKKKMRKKRDGLCSRVLQTQVASRGRTEDWAGRADRRARICLGRERSCRCV